MKNYNSLADAVDDLRKRGYEVDFEPHEDCLYCSNLDLRLYEEEFHVDEVYRFNGNADPDDGSVVYALTAPGGLKGVIVDELPIIKNTKK
ncbi:MAG: phosphoribosylpyrophosphate synthetase [Sphingobacteriales bacterium]|nr:MAG: phosphoribosylpyrophosphate synthetase [Sphingobacteriales bacterium]